MPRHRQEHLLRQNLLWRMRGDLRLQGLAQQRPVPEGRVAVQREIRRGKKCGTPTVTEENIKRGFERMLRQMDKQVQIANLGEIYADVMDYGDLEQEKERLKAERDEVSGRYEKEISQNARVAQDQGEYQKRADELASEYDRLDVEVKTVEAEIQKRQLCGRRIKTLVAALETAGEDFTVSLWGSMVEKVTVFEDGLVFTLTSGEDIRVAPC